MLQAYLCLSLLVAMWTSVAIYYTNAYQSYREKTKLPQWLFQLLVFLVILLFWPLLFAYATKVFIKNK